MRFLKARSDARSVTIKNHFLLAPGDKVLISGAEGKSGEYKVITRQSTGTITLGPLKWYEQAWNNVKKVWKACLKFT